MWLDLSHVIGGFGDRSREIRDEETKRADRAFELERRSLEWLSQSDDPEIRAAAITGILQQSQPKKKGGLAGWFGETEQHPAFATISRMVNTPVMKQRTKRFATPEGGKPMYQMGSQGSAGTMVDNPEFGGAGGRMAALTGEGPPDMQIPGGPDPMRADRPPRPQGPPATGFGAMHEQFGGNQPRTAQAPQQASRPAPAYTPFDTATTQESYLAPRDVFYGPEERVRRQYAAQYGGRIQGIIEGAREAGVDLSPEEIEEIVMAQSGSPSRRNRYGARQVQFKDGTTGVVSYNQATGGWEDGMGNPVDANAIAKFLSTSGSGTRSYKETIQTPQGPREVITTIDNATGQTIHQQDTGAAVPPTPGIVNVPGAGGGTYVVGKDGKPTATKVEGVPPSPVRGGSTGPKADQTAIFTANEIQDDLNLVEKNALAGAKFGNYVDPDALAANRDKAARDLGYASYADLIAKLQEARKRGGTPVGSTPAAPAVPVPGGAATSTPPTPGGAAAASPSEVAPPPTAPTTPPPEGGFGTPQGADAIRRHLPQR